MNRRTLLQRGCAIGTLAIAASSGLLIPGTAIAAYPKQAFQSKDIVSALSAGLGSSDFSASDDIIIKVPGIAENAAVVPIQIISNIEQTESIALILEGSPNPFIAMFKFYDSQAKVSTRIKMLKSGELLVVVKADGRLYAAKQSIAVSESECDA